jgi:hypothetical protein
MKKIPSTQIMRDLDELVFRTAPFLTQEEIDELHNVVWHVRGLTRPEAFLLVVGVIGRMASANRNLAFSGEEIFATVPTGCTCEGLQVRYNAAQIVTVLNMGVTALNKASTENDAKSFDYFHSQDDERLTTEMMREIVRIFAENLDTPCDGKHFNRSLIDMLMDIVKKIDNGTLLERGDGDD